MMGNGSVGGDFHNAIHPPMSAVLPQLDEKPPTWSVLSGSNYDRAYETRGSLSLDEPAVVDEKFAIKQPGFAV